jgi:arylsulfatase A-like enzyme
MEGAHPHGWTRSMNMGMGLFVAVLGAILLGCDRSEALVQAKTNAILITLDTTRIDALSCFSGRAGLTPNLDSLAAQGLRYRWARSVAPVTLPAHASILTGLYPPRHGVRDNGHAALAASAETIAERARAAGYGTGAFVAAAVLDRSFGLSQGFDVYDQPERAELSKTVVYAERPGSEVVGAALDWLEGLDRSTPFFCWVHFFEPHRPYQPQERFLARASGSTYLGEVAAMDEAIGTLLEGLRELNELAGTFIAVAADHGEGMGQHDEETHGNLCYDTTLRVPLLLRYPDGYRSGEESLEIVSLVDLYPTLLAAMGLDGSGEHDGVNLFKRDVPADRGAYFESYHGFLHYGWSPLSGFVDRDLKYLHSSEPELYRPRGDLLEERNLIGTESPQAHQRAIAALLERPSLDSKGSGSVDDDVLRRIESLGYATGSVAQELPHPLAPSDLLSPVAGKAEFTRLNEAIRANETGDFQSAVAILEEIRAKNPRNTAALEYLAFALVESDRCDEALEAISKLLEMGRDRVETLLNAANCLYRRKDHAGAARLLERLLERDPTHRVALKNLEVVYRELGEIEKAEECARRLASAEVEQ